MVNDPQLLIDMRAQAEYERLRAEIRVYAFIADRVEDFNALVAAKGPDGIPLSREDRVLRIAAIPFGGEFD